MAKYKIHVNGNNQIASNQQPVNAVVQQIAQNTAAQQLQQPQASEQDNMRITAGKLRHRLIDMTNLETTRETQDKVRMAIFNMLGQYFEGGVCLDLFAGSGAMGIEAYSRGMEKIYLNDLNKDALNICKKNCKSLGINDVVFTNLDYKDFESNCNDKFDLIILDPPYKMNNIEDILSSIVNLLKKGGKIVFEMAKESNYPNEYLDLVAIKDKSYGIKKVIIYKKG